MNLKTIALTVLFITGSFILHAQDKPYTDDGPAYYYSGSNGNASEPELTTVQMQKDQNTQRQSIGSELDAARLSGDITKTKALEKKLNDLDGASSMPYVNDPLVTGIAQTEQQFLGESGDGVSMIGGNGYWAIATQSTNLSGCIFAAVTEYVSATSDQMKIYVSYNKGLSWVLKGTYSGFTNGVRFYNEELDIEPVIFGTDTLLFAVGGYSYNNNRYSLIARFNIGTGAVSAQSFSFSNGSTKNYNPRVTSDNTVFGNNAYVYITVANDTAIGANNHKLRQRLCIIQNAFASSFTQIHKISNSSAGGFYWYASGAADNAYMWQDVAYYRNSTDLTDNIYTAVTFPGFSNVYAAWSKNGAGTIAGNLMIVETQLVSRVKIAFNGGSGNINGAIVYLKNYTSNPLGDVDVRCQNTTSGGTTLASFTSSYAEFTTDTSTSCDIQAIKLANNKFKFAYSVRGGRCYYLSNTSVSAFTQRLQVNNILAGDGYGRVRAGYRISPTDSCLSVWSKNDGNSMYTTYGCDNFTGVIQNNNQVPGSFELKQNYPNPFNPVTNIKFSVPVAALVKLVVYDITGKEVASLIDKDLAAGNYTVDFDASKLASGVYFYRMDSGNFSDVKKMMLIK